MKSQTSTINREACAWIAKLHDAEPSPQELAALQEWMRRSPEHKAELRRMAKRWGELNVLTELAVPVEVPSLRKIGKVSLFMFLSDRMNAVGALSAAALLVLVGLLWQPFSFTDGDVPSSPSYVTAIGEQRLVTLPDNSTALLNTNSQLRVDYSDGFRNVYLIQGEAHFEVSPNPKQVFRVFAGNGLVRAVGTAFSVRLKEKIVEVTVTQGSVAINAVQDALDSSAGSADAVEKPAVVNAGQSAVFDQVIESVGSVETIDRFEISRKLAWQEGLLRFSDDPLEEVVEEVSRYTPLSIVIVDAELRDLRIGGLFVAGEVEKMFEALEGVFGVRVEHIDENLVHLSMVAPATDSP